MIYARNRVTGEHRAVRSLSQEDNYASSDKWDLLDANDDGWIHWEGGECPLPDGMSCEVKHRDGEVLSRDKVEKGYESAWMRMNLQSDIIAYRPILDAETSEPEAQEWDREPSEQLCRVYFEIAAEVIGEEQVRIRRDIKMRKAAAQRAEEEAVEAMAYACADNPDQPVTWSIYAAIRDGKIPGVKLEGEL